MDQSKDLERIIQRLEVVIALLLRQSKATPNTPTLKEQIQFLNSLGLRPIEISTILGRKQKFISKELSGIRKLEGGESSGS